MQLEVTSLVTHGEVIPGQLGFGTIKGHLVTSKPALVTKDSRTVDGRSSKIKIHVTPNVYTFTLISGLDFAAFLSENRNV